MDNQLEKKMLDFIISDLNDNFNYSEEHFKLVAKHLEVTVEEVWKLNTSLVGKGLIA